MRRPALIAAALLGAWIAAAPARAHIVSDREVRLLQGIPAGLVAALTEPPDSLGHVPPNRAGAWRHVEYQEPGLLRWMDACARADSAAAEAAWRVIEAAMIQQRPAGDYESAAEPRARQLERTAWWIAQLCRAEVVAVNSPLQKRFRWRVNLLLPKLRRSVDWLVAAGEEVLALHARRPELLLVDAQAFLLADGIYHEPRMAELGQRALAAALAAQRKDGACVADGQDLAAHARAATGLLELAVYFPMPTLEEATNRAMRWMDQRLAAAARGTSRLSAVGWRDALVALALQAERVGDRGLRSRVERLAEARTRMAGTR